MNGQPIQYSDIVSQEVQTQLDALTATIKSLTDELSKLNTATEKTEDTTEDYTKTLRDEVEIADDLLKLTRDQIRLKDEIKKATKEHTEAVKMGVVGADRLAVATVKGKEELAKHNRELKNAAKLAIAKKGSMTELSLELAKNKMKYRELTQAQRENVKIGGKLLKTIQNQDANIKKLDKTLGDNQRNVGNYSSDLSGMGGTFGMVGGKITQVTQIFTTLTGGIKAATAATTLSSKAFKIFRLALISTGIGAIVVALGSLIAYLSDTASGTSKLAKAMAPLKAILSTITSLAKQFGEALALFAGGEWDEGFKLLKDSVSGASDEYSRHVAIQKQIAELEDQLHKQRKLSILQIQQMETEQRRLRALSKDEEESLEDRIAAQKEAIRLSKVVAKKKMDIHALEVAILAQQSQLSADSREEEIALEEARAAHSAIVEDYNKKLATMVTYLGGLERKLKGATSAQREFNGTIQKLAPRMATTVDLGEQQIEVIKQSTDWTVASGEAHELTSKQIIGSVSAASGVISQAGKENKEIQLATALINTFAGVAMALASSPPPYSFIQAGLVLAAGLANVATMSNTSVPSYAVGTENVEGDQLANIHDKERIVPAAINKHLTGIDNQELPNIVNMGLSLPSLSVGINSMINQQQNTNSLLRKFAFVDGSGRIHYLTGDTKVHV